MAKILRKTDTISDHTVNRLSLYLRCFTRLREEGVKTVSSHRLAAAGIKAILNFTPVNLRLPPAVKLNTVDLTVEMENLAFFLSHPDARG
jgi:NADH/NAD ratio-sensing transcriptional regulator Rex